ncbi:protein CONSERVED ONLY IN THE GREEN LINEAGE 160, chloroplastic isoform X2 [Telopea speciosissima]|uniref:protein CONSERVED ONLY IN THE GREEN LINEAGE 160, chloroplastic isoform X2 n=1 Tax=Telopea speciosissima TaxID=54955 RepID=UPI001CC66178|nr:protein CONSERVED ONLY IN THE GREEN LINEAGE 160, chloroplastic isoform X2 [Telopea speciosissima]
MAVLNYLCVNSAATPIPQDSTAPPPNPKQTRVVLPKKKPLKWSTGVSPGEYGGPPTTTKLRKYWGGDDEDPLESDDFIWNKEFMGRMKRLFDEPDSSSLQSTPAQSSGFLSLNRAMSLDSVDIDLSKELAAPSKHVLQKQVEAARQGLSVAQSNGSASPRWRLAPTRREQEKWDRASKAATGGSEVMFRELRRPRGDPKVIAAQSREQYFKLKKKLQILTLGIGGVGVVSTYFSYSPEVTASFSAGLLGSLVYIRMLGSSIDSMADGAKGVIKGAIAQPRLLVPVALVMIYNRWNGLLVPEYGLMHLDLIPMLVGFFTYKIATFIQAIEEALRPLTIVEKKTQV